MATKFINKITGTEMWVDDSRVDEYRKLGFKPAKEAVPVSKTVSTETAKEAKEEPKTIKPGSAKKTTRKR